jgi:SAM-dependent methyltransferase
MLLNVEVTAELIDRFRSDLVAAGFFVDNLEALWGPDAAAALHRSHRVPALRAIASSGSDDSALAVLARVFVLGLPVSARLFQSAIPSLGLRGATDLGLVSAQTDMVAPLLDVRPYSFHDSHGEGSWWIASDLGEMALGHAIDERHVLGVGGASLTLAGLMVNSEVSSVLDVGTGCGILALHASRFAERVVATDISPRALEIAALNAALNSISSIEFRLGSLFEPVDGERFDRIVSNPPFVITPRAEGVPRYEYRDGGLEGDAIVERVIRGVEDHLNPGGIAQLLGNWEYREATNAFERVGGWLENTGLDAWVVEREVQVPAQYAETWIRDGGTKPGTTEFDTLYTAWLDDFEARGVTGVGFGYVNLRLPATGDRPWRSLERMDGALGSTFSSTTPGLGAHIEASFAARDWLEGIDDEMLGRSLLTVAPDVTEERHYWPGDDDPTVITLRQGAAFAREVPAGTLIAAVVGACDGDLSVRAICAAVADVLELDEAAVITEVLPSIRELVLWGLLSPESA